jgi:hypothetical protein
VLRTGKPTLFVFFSIIIHVSFALLFSQVTLSFNPPTAKQLTLTLVSGGGGKGDIIQKEAVWTAPQRVEPDFPVGEIYSRLEGEIPYRLSLDQPAEILLAPREALIPSPKVSQVAEEVRPRPPKDLLAPLPAESKAVPTAEFALGSDIPELLNED